MTKHRSQSLSRLGTAERPIRHKAGDHMGPVLGRSRPARPDDLEPPDGPQRRPGVVTVPSRESDELVEDPRLLRSRSADSERIRTPVPSESVQRFRRFRTPREELATHAGAR